MSEQQGTLPLWRLRLRNKVRVAAGNRVEASTSSRLRECYLVIKGSGNRLVIEPGANLRGVKLQLLGEGCELHIGADTVIGAGCYLSSRGKGTRLIVGRDGMFSRHVKVMTGDGHDIVQDGRCINPPRSISIGDHVWLADSATILKGVQIGDNAVIGNGSVVTRDVGGGTVVAGNPAREVKHNINWVR